MWLAGASLSIMEAAGVVGALFGGVVSDRLGRRRVMLGMSVAAPLAALLFLNVRGWLQFPVLLLVGLTLLSTGPVIMALVQEQARASRALANGIFMALNFAPHLAGNRAGRLPRRPLWAAHRLYHRRGGDAGGHAVRMDAAGEERERRAVSSQSGCEKYCA